jgi:hypothetical protein
MPANIFIAGRFDRLRISTPRSYVALINPREESDEK